MKFTALWLLPLIGKAVRCDSAIRGTVPPLRSWAVQVCGVRSGRAILLTTAAGLAIGIELQLARQIWLWLRTRVKESELRLYVTIHVTTSPSNSSLCLYPLELNGGRDRTRTCDLLRVKQAL